MKDTGDLFSKICDMDNLRKAHKNAKRGKGWYAEVKCIEKDLDHYLKRLQENLIEHRYHTSEYEIFTKKESNKEREIYKLPYYPDRICQWAILQVIEPYLLNSMTKDTYSAIPNRGIQPIINQLRGYKKKIKKDGKVVAEKWIPSILVSDPEATKYCLKLDVRKYYPSIVHDVLKAKYRELFKDEELIWLMDEIIDSISTCPATEENIEILQRLSISSKRENNVSPTYSEWCSFNSYVGWLQHCDSFRLYQKYVEPNVEYMHNYYLKEVKGNAEICKRKNYSGERKAS